MIGRMILSEKSATFRDHALAGAYKQIVSEQKTMLSDDPLLQPYRLKHLTLKNRVMSTAHEPAYSEDGLPKERYRLYHAEKAKGGMALTMTAGSAIVSRDSHQAGMMRSARRQKYRSVLDRPMRLWVMR